jgi:hypothetical protein
MRYRFEYTDGTSVILEFETYSQARDFAAMEGDHLIDFTPMED